MIKLLLVFVTATVFCHSAQAEDDLRTRFDSLSETLTNWKQEAVKGFKQARAVLQDYLKLDNIKHTVSNTLDDLYVKSQDVSHTLKEGLDHIKDKVEDTLVTVIGNKTINTIREGFQSVKHKVDDVVAEAVADLFRGNYTANETTSSKVLKSIKEAFVDRISDTTTQKKANSIY